MTQPLLRRLLWIGPTLLGVHLLTFLLVHLAPGEPGPALADAVGGGGVGAGVDAGGPAAATTVGADGAEDARAKFRARHLLDRPLWRQYLHALGPFDLGPDGHRWFGGSGVSPWNGLLVGDLGRFYSRPEPVAPELVRRLRVTLPLAACSVLLTYLLAIPLGLLTGARRGSVLDRGTSWLGLLLVAIPVFWGGLMLQLCFGDPGLGWLPVLGLRSRELEGGGLLVAAWDLVQHLILPVVCMSYASLAYLQRQMRGGVLEVLDQEYVQVARAKGVPPGAILRQHVLRNAALPVVTLMASILPVLVGGSVLVEVVFDLPGMGRLAYEGLVARETDVILATTLLSAAFTVVGILLSDLAQGWLDPRLRHG